MPVCRPRARRLARLLLRAAALLAAAFAAFALLEGNWALATLSRAERNCRYRLESHLFERGLILYAPLENRTPVNVSTGAPLVGTGATSVPGRHGLGRHLGGKPGASLSGDLRWTLLAPTGGTLSLWIRPDPPLRPQRLLCDHEDFKRFGILLSADGRLEADISDGTGATHRLSGPVVRTDRFSHVVFVFSPDRASLWLDGAEVASAPIAKGLALPSHLLSLDTDGHDPPSCTFDEISVWNRPLPPYRIAALHAVRGDLAASLEPVRFLRHRAAAAALRAFLVARRVLARLLPSRGGPARLRDDLPALDLFLSKADERHLLHAHESSLLNGFLTRSAARPRALSATFRSRAFRAEASLDDVYGGAVEARRPAFLLRAAPGLLAPGSGLARLYPPELHAVLHPDAPLPLPLSSARHVRLFVDGDFRGLYVLEPFDREGSAWLAIGRGTSFVRPVALFRDGQPTRPGPGAPLPREEEDAAFGRAVSLARSDPFFPWSATEANWRAKYHRRDRRTAEFAAPALDALDLKGGNPSPLCVVSDLDLSAAPSGTVWRSSAPDVLAPDGRVSRPAGDVPVAAVLSAAFPDGAERSFRFRVMPASPRLPALDLHVGAPVRRDRRRDFTCRRYPAGGGPPEWISGTAAHGGGIRHRGNTSYIKGAKRSLTLKFDLPVPWAGPPARHLLLLSGYADPTRIRNRLSFDAFEALRNGGAPAASGGAGRTSVPVSWAEVYVNGEYAGVWEAVPRMRNLLADRAAPLYKVKAPSALWKASNADMIDRADPFEGPGDPYADFLDLVRAYGAMSDAEFAVRAPELFDLDNLADFLLIVNFTGNEDGRVTNQFVARRRSDGRWILLPWDYDKTFLPGRSERELLFNDLLLRALRAVPGFRDRVAARWAAARAGALSDEALLRKIDEAAALLAPHMEEEYRLLRPAGFDGDFPAAVEELRSEVLLRAARIDREFGR